MGARPIVLSIAGYDPSSGAGVTADIKTAAALGCYAVTCITALTVQSTQGVFGVEAVRAELVRQTLFRLADDVALAAVRIGMLGLGVIRNRLLPLCDVVSPNGEEAAVLADDGAGEVSSSEPWETVLPRIRSLADKLHETGCRGVVITGGHLREANDYLSVWDAGRMTELVFPGVRLDSRATHGTGCAFAAALACGLARGHSLPEAVDGAKAYVRRAILEAYAVGQGNGPMNHLYGLDEPN